MAGIWERIRQLGVCEPAGLPPPYTDLLWTSNPKNEDHWLVGRHPLLSNLAYTLRYDKGLFDRLRATGVQFGFRAQDIPPLRAKRQESYGTAVATAVVNHSRERRQTLHEPLRGSQPPLARQGDKLANVLGYWATQTPQAHHIVEFNNLKAAGVSRRSGTNDLDYDGLPCVLLIAEFHQRFISSQLKFTHASEGSAKEILALLRPPYENLYRKRVPKLVALWSISEIILDAAENEIQ